MSPKEWRLVSVLPLLAVVIGVLILSVTFRIHGNWSCFHFKVELPLIALATMLTLSVLSILIFTWKNNYGRCYVGCIALNMTLAVGLVCVLAVFLSVMAAHPHGHHLLGDDWDEVVSCFDRAMICLQTWTDSSSHHSSCLSGVCPRIDAIRSCCDPQVGCPASMDADCSLWSDEEHCVHCNKCRSATFYRHRAHGRRLMPALIPLIILLPFLVGLQIFVYQRNRWTLDSSHSSPDRPITSTFGWWFPSSLGIPREIELH